MDRPTLRPPGDLRPGVRLDVRDDGPPDGEPVLLLHGFPQDGTSWSGVAPVLRRAGLRTLVPDQRGYNLSDKPRGIRPYTIPVLAADVIGLIDAAGRQQAHIISHDWGSIVHWYLAAQYQERLASSTIINVPHPSAEAKNLWRVPSQMLHSWYMMFFQLPWLPEQWFRRRNWFVGRRFLARTAHPGTFSPEEVERYVAAWSQPRALTSMINWYRGLRYAGRLHWPRIKGPLQVIWGKQDVFLKARMAELSMSQCDNGQLHFFPDNTHWVHLENPQAVNELLLQLMQANPAAD